MKRFTDEVRTAQHQIAQGDVLFTRIDRLPDDVAPRDMSRADAAVLAHSETGHHHVLDAADARIFDGPQSGLVCFLSVGEAGGAYADVVHLRDFDTHATARLTPGYWRVNRQEEPTLDGWRRVED